MVEKLKGTINVQTAVVVATIVLTAVIGTVRIVDTQARTQASLLSLESTLDKIVEANTRDHASIRENMVLLKAKQYEQEGYNRAIAEIVAGVVEQ